MKSSTFNNDPNSFGKRISTIYLAGPMRGFPLYNFPAFHAAQLRLEELGYTVLSPARADEQQGFNPHDKHNFTTGDMCEFIKRDVDMIIRADAIFVLEGWENSMGAQAEVAIAKWKGIPVYREKDGQRVDGSVLAPSPAAKQEDILEEALRITSGDRQAQYGPPDQDFQRTAAMWSALKGVQFTTQDVALFMILLKCSRQIHQQKRDNSVDIAGYARCLQMCADAEEARNPKPLFGGCVAGPNVANRQP